MLKRKHYRCNEESKNTNIHELLKTRNNQAQEEELNAELQLVEINSTKKEIIEDQDIIKD